MDLCDSLHPHHSASQEPRTEPRPTLFLLPGRVSSWTEWTKTWLSVLVPTQGQSPCSTHEGSYGTLKILPNNGPPVLLQ